MIGATMTQAPADFCPGILHTVPAKDGLLMRLRLPGGQLPAAMLAALADLARRHADGGLDLTARANIQLRGIRPESLAPLVEGLRAAGLLPSPAHDRIRNILVSPFAGADPTELLDLTPFALALDRALIADADLARLPAKFAFTLDGGGRGFDPGGADLTLTAIAGSRLHLSVAGRPTGLGVAPDNAVALLVRACHALLAIARAHDLPARGRAIATLPAAYDEFLNRLAMEACPPPPRRALSPMFGILDEPAGRVTLLPTIPFGRLTADQAMLFADHADRFGLDMRLTPWRTLALRGVARSDIPAFDLTSDGFAGLAACAGSAGCAQSLADVRGDARRFAAEIADTAPPADWTIHFAGCAKRCALRGRATVDLIATQNGYDVLFDGTPARTGLSPDQALAAARTAYPTKAPPSP
jgi:precorrin-3B synthase